MTIGFYRKLKYHVGIYQHTTTKRYMAQKKIKNEKFQLTFDMLDEAIRWRKDFNGDPKSFKAIGEGRCKTLKEVWSVMNSKHISNLMESTKGIWWRRYELLKELEHLPMDMITSSVISSWVERQVKFYRSDEYEQSCRGRAKRCNLDNELNLLVTIWNWAKDDEAFEKELITLPCPVKTKHKKLGFVRPKPVRELNISVDEVLLFLNYLSPLYKDFAYLQYLTASRVSEIAGLQWPRIDLKNQKLVIMETAQWDMSNKTFLKLIPHPKNKEPRPAYINEEIRAILKRRQAFKIPGNDFVFHVEGVPLNYCTIQLNYREAQRKAGLKCSGTHILRHGMAKLARRVGGGLDAVIAITGHKDLKLADHYSKLDQNYHRDISLKIENEIKKTYTSNFEEANVVSLQKYKDMR